jgi:hypothetical protein
MDSAIDHFFIYCLACLAFVFFQVLYGIYLWWFWIALIASFVWMNPDLLDKIFRDHRNFISHSGLYPIAMYWVFHPFWNMNNALLLGVVLFYPILIHLMGDFYSIWKKLQGYATISCFGKRLNDTQSKLYVLMNIIGITVYMIYVL